MSAGDVGLSRERTRLSWRRTTLSAAGVALLAAARVVNGSPGPLALAAIAGMALIWLGVLATAHGRIRGLSHPRAGATPATLALLTAGYAVLGLLVVVG